MKRKRRMLVETVLKKTPKGGPETLLFQADDLLIRTNKYLRSYVLHCHVVCKQTLSFITDDLLVKFESYLLAFYCQVSIYTIHLKCKEE